jgi:hypothetical protein
MDDRAVAPLQIVAVVGIGAVGQRLTREPVKFGNSSSLA